MTSAPDTQAPPHALLDRDAEYLMPLVHREDINHDTRIFRYALPSKAHVLGLPVGQHVFLTAQVNGERVCRKYTPISSDETLGHMDLIVKVYFKDAHPSYPAGGKLTQHLESMRLGDEISVRGPIGRLVYAAPGEMHVRRVKNDPASVVTLRAAKVNMIAGGSGIAPMLQLIRQITGDPRDSTQIALLFANQSEDDIVLRKELDACATQHPEQFRVWYTVDRPPPTGWQYSVGYVSADMIQKHLFPPGADTAVLMCGPKPMIKQACIPHLESLGYEPDMRFKY